MIDLTQILITEETVIQRLFCDTRLYWIGEKEYLNYDKESIRTSIKKEYKGVIFNFHHGKLEILFKPHYYFNNNLHNANDFTVKDCINTFKEFFQCFGINLKDAKINNLEFGLNIVSPIPVRDLITYIKYYHRNAFINQTGLRYSKISSSINSKGKLNSYKMFKAYAKSVQFPQYAVKDLVRLEVKSCESKFINSLGIYTANDVMNPLVYRELSNILYKEFSEVLIMDYGLMPNLNTKDSKRLRKYLNPDIWYRYLQGSKNTFNDNKKKYLAIVRLNPENLFDKLLLLIKNKFVELNNCELKNDSQIKKSVRIPPLVYMEMAQN